MSDKFAVLGFLKQGDLYGYEISKLLKQVEGFWYIFPGNLYKALASLERDGLIESTGKQEHEGRIRKIYHIKEKGVLEFEKWVSRPATPVKTRHEAYLKMWFSQGNREKLKTQVQQIRDYSAEVMRLIDSASVPSDSKTVSWLLDIGRRHIMLDLEWSNRLLNALSETNSRGESE